MNKTKISLAILLVVALLLTSILPAFAQARYGGKKIFFVFEKKKAPALFWVFPDTHNVVRVVADEKVKSP